MVYKANILGDKIMGDFDDDATDAYLDTRGRILEDSAFAREQRRHDRDVEIAKRAAKGLAKDFREALEDPDTRRNLAKDAIRAFRDSDNPLRRATYREGYVNYDFDAGWDFDELRRRAWERE